MNRFNCNINFHLVGSGRILDASRAFHQLPLEKVGASYIARSLELIYFLLFLKKLIILVGIINLLKT